MIPSSGELTPRGYPCLLGPSVELVEDPGQFPAPAAEPVAPARVPFHHPGVEQLRQPRGEDRRADPGPLAELGEGERAPPQLPEQAKGPAPAEQVEGALNGSLARH